MNEERIFDTLMRLEQHSAVTNERLKTYNDQLELHIKRTELLEKDMQTALLPIKVAKVLAAACAGAGSILAVLQALGKL